MKYVLRQAADEDIYYDFEEEVCFADSFKDRVIIYGNRDFQAFGDDTLLQIVKGEYYDDDPAEDASGEPIGYDYDIYEELEKVTGKHWECACMRGYSQGDWQDLYYVEGEVSQDEIDYLEAFYMGKVDEYEVFELADDEEFDEHESDRYHAFVPHDITWKEDKKAICDYLGIDASETKLYKYAGYHKVADYEEVE